MSIQRRLIYMFLGGLLTLALFVGAFATFAQSGEEGATEEPAESETESEAGSAESSTEEVLPFSGRFGFRGQPGRGYMSSNDSELLADALGITVEELEAAYEAATEAAIQQAVDEELLTEEQAEALSSRGFGFHNGFGFGLQIGSIDFDALLADALGISIEELQDARNEVHEARLAEMVEAGVITQEQADLMLARKAVQDYIDTEAISDALQSAYETAVNDALAAGAITEEQADLMLENMPSFDRQGLGIGGGLGFHGQGSRGFHGPGGPGGFFAPSFGSSTNAETSGA